MSHKRQEKQWINELKEDLPEYAQSIERVDLKVALFFELLEDYFLCKQQMKKIMQTGNTKMAQEFALELEDLKDEIRSALIKNEIFPQL